jgi:hypothetical protein
VELEGPHRVVSTLRRPSLMGDRPPLSADMQIGTCVHAHTQMHTQLPEQMHSSKKTSLTGIIWDEGGTEGSLVSASRCLLFLTSSPLNLPAPPQRDEDAENLGHFVMFPANGSIDLMYFPYYGKKFHVSPTSEGP